MRLLRASYFTHAQSQGGELTCRSLRHVLAELRSVNVACSPVHTKSAAKPWPPFGRNSKTLSQQPLCLCGPHVLHIYHLLICYNWCGERWEPGVLIELLPLVKMIKAFLEWKERLFLPIHAILRTKVQGQRTACGISRGGHRHSFGAPMVVQIT